VSVPRWASGSPDERADAAAVCAPRRALDTPDIVGVVAGSCWSDIVGVVATAALASSTVLLDAATAAAWRDDVISQMTMRALLV
jgi:hypothetical protein